jgi:hypothetical protein
MAIGSEGEIGVKFGKWGDMTEEQKDLWCKYVREVWGKDLLGGYATLHYPKRYPNGEMPENEG